MKKIRLDGKEYEFKAGERILAVTTRAGISVPLLCHSAETGCGGRCMVCAVRNIDTGAFIPTCVAVCAEDMNLDTCSQQVIDFRKTAIELLLSEHRGDCEAPCRLVCPQALEIPDFLAKLATADSSLQFDFNPEICEKCGDRCEKACRRGRVDQAISIRLLLLQSANKNFSTPEPRKPCYQHLFGGSSAQQIIDYFIKPYAEQLTAFDENISSGQKEACRCLQCACAASHDCQLRQLADALKAKQHGFKSDAMELLPPVVAPAIVFEAGKCIRCHRCVELGKKLKPGCGPVMVWRGRNSLPAAPINSDFSATFAGYEDRFIAECPTGALARPRAVNRS